ncbi:uncharacterized protein LOC141894462 [Acropora palmata]|uniref:uncharacterized protein LOC141894462 n=1 Tax=Acropora palmata TaxID=6131 RepID=UPI003DA08980
MEKRCGLSGSLYVMQIARLIKTKLGRIDCVTSRKNICDNTKRSQANREAKSGGMSDQSDSNENLRLMEPTPGFGNCQRSLKRPEVFESWEEEEYFPGKPRIPLGSYKYNKLN